MAQTYSWEARIKLSLQMTVTYFDNQSEKLKDAIAKAADASRARVKIQGSLRGHNWSGGRTLELLTRTLLRVGTARGRGGAEPAASSTASGHGGARGPPRAAAGHGGALGAAEDLIEWQAGRCLRHHHSSSLLLLFSSSLVLLPPPSSTLHPSFPSSLPPSSPPCLRFSL